MASIAYAILLLMSTYQIVAGDDIVNILRSIAEDANVASPVKSEPPQLLHRGSSASRLDRQQPLVVILGDGILEKLHNKHYSLPPHHHHHNHHRPRAVTEKISEKSKLISQLIALLQAKQKAEAPVAQSLPKLLEEKSPHLPIMKTLLRYSQSLNCNKRDECEDKCTTGDCVDDCDKKYECDDKPTPPPQDDYCDPCEENDTECGQRDNCPMSTKGYTMEPGRPIHCNECYDKNKNNY